MSTTIMLGLCPTFCVQPLFGQRSTLLVSFLKRPTYTDHLTVIDAVGGVGHRAIVIEDKVTVIDGNHFNAYLPQTMDASHDELAVFSPLIQVRHHTLRDQADAVGFKPRLRRQLCGCVLRHLRQRSSKLRDCVRHYDVMLDQQRPDRIAEFRLSLDETHTDPVQRQQVLLFERAR